MADIQKDPVLEQIESLRAQVEYHADRYYNQDDPEISDFEYDKLFHQLLDLEEQNPQYYSPTSPTVRVGGTASNTFATVEHKVQMGSLQDIFSFEELRDFDRRVRETIPNPSYVVEPKIDGLSVSLEYRDGVLAIGSTRGNGFTGEDVSENIRTIRSVPLKLPEPLPLLEVRGEVYMPVKSFQKVVEAQELAGEQPFKNPATPPPVPCVRRTPKSPRGGDWISSSLTSSRWRGKAFPPTAIPWISSRAWASRSSQSTRPTMILTRSSGALKKLGKTGENTPLASTAQL